MQADSGSVSRRVRGASATVRGEGAAMTTRNAMRKSTVWTGAADARRVGVAVAAVAFSALLGAQAAAQGTSDPAAAALSLLTDVNESLAGAVCDLSVDDRIAYEREAPAIMLSEDQSAVTYHYLRSRPVSSRIAGQAGPQFEGFSYTAALADLDLARLPPSYNRGDCRSMEMVCKADAADCITVEAQFAGKLRISRREYVEVQLPTDSHVEMFEKLFTAASVEVGETR